MLISLRKSDQSSFENSVRVSQRIKFQPSNEVAFFMKSRTSDIKSERGYLIAVI